LTAVAIAILAMVWAAVCQHRIAAVSTRLDMGILVQQSQESRIARLEEGSEPADMPQVTK
jgi:hypothetical protein